MELLHMMPIGWMSFIVHGTLIVGIVLSIISVFGMNLLSKFIPSLSASTALLQVVSILILAVGVYLKGGYEAEILWHKQVVELEAKLKIASVQSKQANATIEQQVVTEIKEVKVKGDQIIKYIDREVVKYDSTCAVPNEVIKALNAAAENKLIDE